MQPWRLEPAGGIVAHREQHRHRLRAEPSSDEQHRLRRRGIDPLEVVDDAQKRAVLGRLREQAESRQTQQQTILHALLTHSQSAPQGGGLRAGQTIDQRVQRAQQLLQAGEGEVVLGLRPRAAKRSQARAPRRVIEHRGLPDPGLAADHQRSARAGARIIEQALD